MKKVMLIVSIIIFFVAIPVRKHFLSENLELLLNMFLIFLGIYLFYLSEKGNLKYQKLFQKYKWIILIVTILTLLVYFYLSSLV